MPTQVLGLGLMSTHDYKPFVDRTRRAVAPYQDQPGKLQMMVDGIQNRPHCTILFVDTPENKIDTFTMLAGKIANETQPIKVATTKYVLGEDGMRERQLEKTAPLIRLQDRAIYHLKPLIQTWRSKLSDGTPMIWPKKSPTGEDLDQTLAVLDSSDSKRQQYATIGYDEANGDALLLNRILNGEQRTARELRQAKLSSNRFNRFRPHETDMRLNPTMITDEDKKRLNKPTEGEIVEYDLLVVSKRGDNGTFSRPIAAFDLGKPIGQKKIKLDAKSIPVPVQPEPVHFGERRQNKSANPFCSKTDAPKEST